MIGCSFNWRQAVLGEQQLGAMAKDNLRSRGWTGGVKQIKLDKSEKKKNILKQTRTKKHEV